MSHFTVQVTWDDEEPAKRAVADELAQVVIGVNGVTRTKVYSSHDGELLADVFSEDYDDEDDEDYFSVAYITEDGLLIASSGAEPSPIEGAYIEPEALFTFTILAIVVGALAYLIWHLLKAGIFWM